MTSRTRYTARFAALVLGASLTVAAVAPDAMDYFHERKEVAGLLVVFGAEPEPALTDEMQFLRWRVSTLEDPKPSETMTEPAVKVMFNGGEYGPFAVRPVRGTPGGFETRHIFTAAGTYQSVLTFKKGEETEVRTVDFEFNIGDRAGMEIPRRRGGH